MKIVAFIGYLESEKNYFPLCIHFKLVLGCAASGFRYYVDTFRTTGRFSLCYPKRGTAQAFKVLVADEIIKAQKLIDECKKVLKAGWQTQFEPFFNLLSM